ncbi:phthiocerol/phthiodiolone dimycocerosyl transferase family protein [Nocardia sp. CA-136227]|uniref:phthiocerol/phthiodiolone dimycocerosyl transferase family protein n=1 Tax=Nocardia sp. CA-136227 TaxID=3239979 RepID=UPI003D962A76
MTMVQRPLTSGESATVRSGTSPIFAVLTVQGSIDSALLERAWESLAMEHPLLRSRIVTDGRGGYVVAVGAAAAEPVEYSGSEDQLVELLHRRWAVGDPVAQAILLRGSETCLLGVALHHAVADGRLTVTLLHKLAHRFTLLATAAPLPPISARQLETPLEDRLTHLRGADTARAASPIGVARLPHPEHGDARESGTFEIRNIKFTIAETDRVETVAKAWQVSVNSVLSASVITALRSMFDSSGPVPLGIGYPIDLRNRLDPPLPPDAELCCVASWSVILQPTAATSVGECSSAIQEALEHAVAAEAPQRAMANGSSDTWRTNSVSLSNLGRLELPAAPPGMRFTHTRFMAISPVPHPAIFVTNTENRLNLDVVYDRGIVSDRDGRRLVDRVERTIRTLPGNTSGQGCPFGAADLISK